MLCINAVTWPDPSLIFFVTYFFTRIMYWFTQSTGAQYAWTLFLEVVILMSVTAENSAWKKNQIFSDFDCNILKCIIEFVSILKIVQTRLTVNGVKHYIQPKYILAPACIHYLKWTRIMQISLKDFLWNWNVRINAAQSKVVVAEVDRGTRGTGCLPTR